MPQLLRWRNQEQRQVALRVLGGEALLRALKADEILRDECGVLIEVPGGVGDGEPVARLVRVTCPSTGRVYCLRVPGETATARAAVARTTSGPGQVAAIYQLPGLPAGCPPASRGVPEDHRGHPRAHRER